MEEGDPLSVLFFLLTVKALLSFFLSPCAARAVPGLHKHPEARSEGKRKRRQQRVATISPMAPQGSYLPLSSSSCKLSPLACLLYDQAPLLFTLQSSPLCSTLRVIFSCLAQNSLCVALAAFYLPAGDRAEEPRCLASP